MLVVTEYTVRNMGKSMKSNIILYGDAIEKLKELDTESIDMCLTSPPYWGLRDYGTFTWVGGNEDCDHVKSNISELKGDWERPSRIEFNKVGEILECVVCKKQFKGKLGNKFCSTECLNTLSNEDRTNARSKRTTICQKCGAKRVDKQLGLEPTFDEYINKLCDIFDIVNERLKKEGTLWVNIGDTYGGSGCGKGDERNNNKRSASNPSLYKDKPNPQRLLQPKSLVMIPFRFALEMVNRGWILRNTIIWHKPNCMPSSVRDRFTVDFEYLFFFSKNKKYFFNQQFDRADTSESVYRNKLRKHKSYNIKYPGYKDNFPIPRADGNKNKRSVWQITTKPFSEAHFAVYPEELCETPIKAGCPEFVCKKCGKAREKIIITNNPSKEFEEKMKEEAKNRGYTEHSSARLYTSLHAKGKNWKKESQFGGLTNCGCDEEFIGGIVLDPFFGAGTTGLVALKQNKKFIGIELNPEYIKIAKERLKPLLEQNTL